MNTLRTCNDQMTSGHLPVGTTCVHIINTPFFGNIFKNMNSVHISFDSAHIFCEVVLKQIATVFICCDRVDIIVQQCSYLLQQLLRQCSYLLQQCPYLLQQYRYLLRCGVKTCYDTPCCEKIEKKRKK